MSVISQPHAEAAKVIIRPAERRDFHYNGAGGNNADNRVRLSQAFSRAD